MVESLEVKIINLERAAARREVIRQQFDQSSLNWSFFNAHTSLDTTEISYSPQRISRNFGRMLSTPEQAVWSSHYFAMKTFLDQSSHNFLLVFEDDVLFDVALPVDRLMDYMTRNDIHYMRLFGMYNAAATRITAWYDRSILRYKSSPAGAQAYLLSREGAARMVASLRTVNATIDLAMDEFWRTKLPIYSLFPFPVIERFSPTSIPMQPAEALDSTVKVARLVHRVSEKLKKIGENVMLSKSDAQLRTKAGVFQQINSEDVPESR